MKKIRAYLYALVLALAIIYLQKNWLVSVGGNSGRDFYAFNFSNIFLQAAVTGVMFGVLGCPGCSLAVFFGSCLPYSTKKDIIFRNVLFHSVRVISIFVFTLVSNILFTWLKDFSSYLALGGASIIMIYLGIRLILFSSNRCLSYDYRKKGFIYALWGILWGGMCGVEAIGFLVPLWLQSISWPERIVSLIIFSVTGVVVPILIVVILTYLRHSILNNVRKEWQSIIQFTGAFYLLIVGIIFLRGTLAYG